MKYYFALKKTLWIKLRPKFEGGPSTRIWLSLFSSFDSSLDTTSESCLFTIPLIHLSSSSWIVNDYRPLAIFVILLTPRRRSILIHVFGIGFYLLPIRSNFSERSCLTALNGSENLWTHFPVSNSQSLTFFSESLVKMYLLLFMRWYSVNSGKPKNILVLSSILTSNFLWWFSEDFIFKKIFTFFYIAFYTLNGRLLSTVPDLIIYFIVFYTNNWFVPFEQYSCFAFFKVHFTNFPILSACPYCRFILTIRQNWPNRLGVEIILRIFTDTFSSVYFNHCSFSNIP